MKFSVFYVFVICILGALAVDDPPTTPSTTLSTTAVPPTTPKPTEPTPTTTIAPTTTPATTVPSPTTTPPTTSTSMTTVPSTTHKPTTPPEPVEGDWNVTENNVTCIRAKMFVQIYVTPLNVTHNLSPDASSVQSTCNATHGTQQLVLKDGDYELNLTFTRDNVKTYVQNISLSFKIGTEVLTNEISGDYFKAHNERSYYCMSDAKVSLENSTLTFSKVQLQAFGKADDKDFLKAEDCDADDKMNDIVPIAVACALCGMVVIILIGYLIGRRQTRQRGYQSV